MLVEKNPPLSPAEATGGEGWQEQEARPGETVSGGGGSGEVGESEGICTWA